MKMAINLLGEFLPVEWASWYMKEWSGSSTQFKYNNSKTPEIYLQLHVQW